MIKYLVILLDDTSVSYCHYDNPSRQSSLIPIDALREGICDDGESSSTVRVSRI